MRLTVTYCGRVSIMQVRLSRNTTAATLSQFVICGDPEAKTLMRRLPRAARVVCRRSYYWGCLRELGKMVGPACVRKPADALLLIPSVLQAASPLGIKSTAANGVRKANHEWNAVPEQEQRLRIHRT